MIRLDGIGTIQYLLFFSKKIFSKKKKFTQSTKFFIDYLVNFMINTF